MGRSTKTGILALAIALAVAAGAPAARGATVSSADAVARSCAESLLPDGTSGIDRQSWIAPASGLLTADLAGGPEGDWDLALFALPEGEAIGASTSFRSDERVTVWVEPGDQVAIQACRRNAGPETVPLNLGLYAMSPVGPSERISLESVPISGPVDLARLEGLGLDVTHDVSPSAATVALYSDAERALLAGAGFTSQTLIADLAAADELDRADERQAEASAGVSALPSARETYRVYEDYTSEMKALAEANPSFVRPVTIGKTFEGRDIQGLEIAAEVNRSDDGRPVYLNMGLHHAREWPSGELPMEFAIDLVNGFNNGNARITSLLQQARLFIFPVINVDAFIASRSFGTSPLDDNSNATLGLSANDAAAYKRKNCRPTVAADAALPCALRLNSGIDLNRNYGAYWGGSGSSSTPTAQNYRGTAPYSEPESEAVHQLSSKIHPTVFITNHTFTADGKWLRQPGFNDVIAVTPDEAAMKELGDAMAAATGWTSELGYATLGDITGATEDWNYFAQGTYGYTPEIRGSNFHANYATAVVREYVGDANHQGLGTREAFLISGERTFNTADHGVIFGNAPKGATLRLRKQFQTPTSQANLFVNDFLDTTLTVPASGRYTWHVNPSSRPDVDPGPGRTPPAETWTMSCQPPGGAEVTRSVSIARGEQVEVSWRGVCRKGR